MVGLKISVTRKIYVAEDMDKEQIFEYAIPDESTLTEIKANGIIVRGGYVELTKVELVTNSEIEEPDTPDEEGTTTELWSGEQATGEDWSGYVDLSYGDRGILVDAKIGDVITVTFHTAADVTYANVQIGSLVTWQAIDENAEANVTPSDENQTFSYEIPSVEILEEIQQYGITVRGGNIIITKVELTTYPSSYNVALVTIGDAGVATYSNSSKTLDFTGADIKAYYATAVEIGKVTLSPVTIVPAYTGIIVKGDPGSYEIPVGEGTNETTNYLKAIGDWDQTVTASAEGTYHYTFSEDQNATFSLVSAETTVPARKAYLETTTDITPTEGTIELVFTDDESTGISNIEVNKIEDDAYYNLQGMRVEHPSKGIYIHNGKKVIIR